MERDRSTPATVEVCVRSLSPGRSLHQRPILEQLNASSGREVIDYWTVHVVGERVCPNTASTTRPGRFICERIQQFKEWAARNDISFGQFFEHRRVTSQLTGEEYETMILPSVTLAEFDDQDTVRFVAPSFDGETQHTPASRLEGLVDERGDDHELVM